MPETICVGATWPYANGQAHQVHFAGVYLPADIFARDNRTACNRVLPETLFKQLDDAIVEEARLGP